MVNLSRAESSTVPLPNTLELSKPDSLYATYDSTSTGLLTTKRNASELNRVICGIIERNTFTLLFIRSMRVSPCFCGTPAVIIIMPQSRRSE